MRTKTRKLYKRTTFAAVATALLAIAVGVVSSACQGPIPDRPVPQMTTVNPPEVMVDYKTGEKTVRLRVLTYNVAALPPPIGFGREGALEEMGRYLASIQDSNIAPHIVLLQEAFDPEAVAPLMKYSGYPNYVHGPKRKDRAPKLDPEYTQNFKRKQYIFTGEGWGKLNHSGLAILSNLPIVEKHSRPFRYCAGWDCLANKGVLAVEVEIPGVPDNLLIANTHLNARKASKVPKGRSLFAHNLQVYELKYFAKTTWDRQMPLIFGGDFNIRNKEDRIQHALAVLGEDEPYMLPRYYCLDPRNNCDIQLDLEGERPWARTQDIQGFANGNRVSVEPVKIMAMFDGGVFGEELSDHDGYLVEYLLRWR